MTRLMTRLKRQLATNLQNSGRWVKKGHSARFKGKCASLNDVRRAKPREQQTNAFVVRRET
jgi:hypothetical protein